MNEDNRRHFVQDMRLGTPRANRAMRFSNTVMAMMRDFVPRDRECSERLHAFLIEVGYQQNLEIISVPPECDALDKLALEQRRLEISARPIVLQMPVKDPG